MNIKGLSLIILEKSERFKRVIRKTMETHWSEIDFFENVLLVLPVPIKYSENKMIITRECLYDAGLLKEKWSTKLQFTSEYFQNVRIIIYLKFQIYEF